MTSEKVISERRRNCEHFARCGEDGHFVENGQWVRCPCVVEDERERILGEFYCEDPVLDTDLTDKLDRNLIVEGTRAEVCRHLAGAFLHLEQKNRTWVSVTSERLLEIWLGNDDDGFRSAAPLEHKDLVFLWLGWGETLPNKCRPDAILDLLGRRARVRRPLWIYMNFDFGDVANRYGSMELTRQLKAFDRIEPA